MTKNKYATVDFDQVNEKGLKSLIAAINKTGVTVTGSPIAIRWLLSSSY